MSNGGSWGYLTPFLELVRSILIAYAKAGRTVTYEQLVEDVKAIRGRCSPHWRMGSHLGRISHWERDHGRPLLSAIVLNRDGTIGPGFWTMTRDEMGIPVFNKDEFLAAMQRSVWGYWQGPYDAEGIRPSR